MCSASHGMRDLWPRLSALRWTTLLAGLTGPDRGASALVGVWGVLDIGFTLFAWYAAVTLRSCCIAIKFN